MQFLILPRPSEPLTGPHASSLIPRAVVFDMDGLLFDTETIYRDAMVATASRLGFEMSNALFLAMVGLPSEASRKLLVDHYGAEFDVDVF